LIRLIRGACPVRFERRWWVDRSTSRARQTQRTLTRQAAFDAMLETWTKTRIMRLFEQIDDLEARADRLVRRSASAPTWSDSIH
jgi:hypothetical protein